MCVCLFAFVHVNNERVHVSEFQFMFSINPSNLTMNTSILRIKDHTINHISLKVLTIKNLH